MAQRRRALSGLDRGMGTTKKRTKRQRRTEDALAKEEERLEATQSRVEQLGIRTARLENKRGQGQSQLSYLGSRLAEVETLNKDLAIQYEQIDGILTVALGVDSSVALDALKLQVRHPPFARADLETPKPQPEPLAMKPAPAEQPPEPVRSSFRRRRKEHEARERAKAEYDVALRQWEAERSSIAAHQEQLEQEHQAMEQARIALLESERVRYTDECHLREKAVSEHNARLDALMARLDHDCPKAVEEYIGIVLARSSYPPHFEVKHEAEFTQETSELDLDIVIPAPRHVPTVKSYRYVKFKDEISATQLPRQEVQNRYSAAMHQVALRSMHEVFEADRKGTVNVISAQVGTRAVDPATGLNRFVPLLRVSVDRDTFSSFNLAAVTPAATLRLLGAVMSDNPIELEAIHPV